VATQIKNILFKEGLFNEIEVIPIADTIAKHRDNITLPHRDSFYNIFWYQKGSAIHFVDFKPIKVKPNSILFVDKNRVQILTRKVVMMANFYFLQIVFLISSRITASI